MPENRQPPFVLTCPQCGEALRYISTIKSGSVPLQPGVTITTNADMHIYRCPRDGQFRFMQEDGLSDVGGSIDLSTLAEIREQLITLKNRGGTRRCRQVRQLLVTKIAQVDAQREQLDEFRRTLQALADQCEESLRQAPDPECPVIAKL
jgi:hypothetical protein